MLRKKCAKPSALFWSGVPEQVSKSSTNR